MHNLIQELLNYLTVVVKHVNITSLNVLSYFQQIISNYDEYEFASMKAVLILHECS